ncbi:hypothetical protein N658DRAFT_78531 [Parathielavia hyrcaniae]|uniref:Uncharacterized protein n=1 Tax=Parathielavia hyrcaniae TaxID=113614 RepID=A0AAN6T1Q6_9PEZI|nr:hypothetical protein N658DRAFT_78531 [Parathielavia hyrcaniae]
MSKEYSRESRESTMPQQAFATLIADKECASQHLLSFRGTYETISSLTRESSDRKPFPSGCNRPPAADQSRRMCLSVDHPYPLRRFSSQSGATRPRVRLYGVLLRAHASSRGVPPRSLCSAHGVKVQRQPSPRPQLTGTSDVLGTRSCLYVAWQGSLLRDEEQK